jgi:hypothetical protein
MWAYSMIAIGTINWDYQRHHSHVVLNSLLIIVPGLVLLALTFTDGGKKLLQNQIVKWGWAVIGIAALVFAFTNK